MFGPLSAGRLTRLAVLALCLVVAAFAALPAWAQVPTAEQIEAFQNLPPAQQQAILEAMGQQGLSAGGGASRDRPLEFPEVVERGNRQAADEARVREQMGVDGQARLKAGDTLLISLELRKVPSEAEDRASARRTGRDAMERPPAEAERLAELRTRILRRNPYQLDKWGILNVPDLGPMPMAGLNAEQAAQRLAAEPLLADFEVGVTYLPVNPVGIQALKPFGYEAFEGTPSTFAPATDVPVPAEYVIGPGDTLEVQLTGNLRGRHSLVVGRNGEINFPEIGAIAVGGMRFEEAREMLRQRVADQLIGTQASIQMGELRSIRIFVLGDANQPGSYTVSGLSTITNALFVSGGVRRIGSLRNIELKRNGRTVVRFDLYDLLLRGDTRADVRLLPGDVIFIPPVGPMVGVTGEVRRPALYELKGETTTSELIELAGGLTAEADPTRATLDRVDRERQRVVVDVDVSVPSEALALRNGDVLNVPAVRPTVDQAVKLTGHVFRPGEFQYRPGMRISQLIPSLEELKDGADQHYVLIRREVPPTRRVEFVSVDLARALEQPGGEHDLPLAPRDQVFVFDLETGRDRLIQPLLRELRLQSNQAEPRMEVSIGGRVNAPGPYPLEPGMRVSDLVRAGASLNEAAYGGTAELTRYSVEDGQSRRTELIEIDLARAMAGDPQADIELQPFDFLVIKELPLWASQEYVEVQGEVRFPGRYPIRRGETLRSVVERAGGLTDLAFVEGTVFTRESLKERERRQLEDLIERLKLDMAQVALMTAQSSTGDALQALSVGQQLMQQLMDAEPVGRLVIDLNRVLSSPPGSEHDVMLKNGDRLLVPRLTQEVTVMGEVQSPTSHLYDASLTRNDYIQMSGGTTQRADKKRIYIVRADGSVIAGGGSAWFSTSANATIHPGDTIVVPFDAERVRLLPVWQSVTTIIYNMAIAVAAVNSF